MKEPNFGEKIKLVIETDHLNNLGVTEFKKGNIIGAIRYYKQALDIMPENDDALINIASCYNKLGNYDEAIEYCLLAIKIDSNRPEGYRTIGDAHYYQSDIANVIKWYKEASLRGDESTTKWLRTNGYI